MKKVIIGIHGLGNKPPKDLLQKWWKDAMKEGLELAGINKKLPDFELVYWADILHEKPLDRSVKYKRSPYYLDEPYTKSSKNTVAEKHAFLPKIIDLITKWLNKILLNEDKTLNYSFITDAILKRYFTDLEIYYMEECKDEHGIKCKARDLIRKRVAEPIKKYQGYDIMIVAHSMGCILAFDVLNFQIPEIEIDTLITIGSPLGLPIVIGKIAAEQKKKLNGKSVMSTPPGIKSNWFNLADIRDHIALNYKLGDDFSKNSRGVFPIDFLVYNNYEIKGEKNPHKSFGYLRSPEFSKILGNFIGEEKHNLGQKVMEKVQGIIGKVKEQRQTVKDKLQYTEDEKRKDVV